MTDSAVKEWERRANKPPSCEVRMNVHALCINPERVRGWVTTADMGHRCPRTSIGTFTVDAEGHPEMEFHLCEVHRRALENRIFSTEAFYGGEST